jgi:hypothetical protein
LCDDQETMASVATTLSLIRSSLAASKAGSKYCETPRYEVSRSTSRMLKNSRRPRRPELAQGFD